MAFPWVFESNWESGGIEWDTETDTASQLDIAHYSQLAKLPYGNCTPFSGAYCMRLALTGGTADAYLEEADINIGANTTHYFAFNIWFSNDFDATADDTVNVFEALGSGTVEATFGFRYVASTDEIQLGIGETAPTSFGNGIKRNTWYTVELAVDVDNAVANDGTIDIYVTEEGHRANETVYAAQVGSLDQGAITDGRIGVQDHLATTTGVILIDNFIQDDARIYAERRFSRQFTITQSGHVLVGPGAIDVSLLSGGGTDCVLTVYDTDNADTNNGSDILAEVKNTANNEYVANADLILPRRGAYVALSGTNPRALITVNRGSIRSPGAIKHHGLHRTGVL